MIDYWYSPYLAAGVISSRECIRAALELVGATKVNAKRDTGIGTWIQEIGDYLCRASPFCSLTGILLAWRDFYTHVLAAFPRVSMGRPFQEKYDDVHWETNPEHFEAWRTGRTGVPIVDAAIRQANTMGLLSPIVTSAQGLTFTSAGWMHNRARMIAAMYLTKDLMIDWRLGERVCDYSYLILLTNHRCSTSCSNS